MGIALFIELDVLVRCKAHAFVKAHRDGVLLVDGKLAYAEFANYKAQKLLFKPKAACLRCEEQHLKPAVFRAEEGDKFSAVVLREHKVLHGTDCIISLSERKLCVARTDFSHTATRFSISSGARSATSYIFIDLALSFIRFASLKEGSPNTYIISAAEFLVK